MLGPNPTPYDLHWRMFGIDVRVHPMFWLISALLGGNLLEAGLSYLLLWVGCVFVSILIHELGHVVMGQVFGVPGRIVLYSLGGLAIQANAVRYRWQHILICFAGPLAGFVFIGLVWLAMRNFANAATPLWVFVTFNFLVWINLFWGLVNLLPIWPLDGGQISRDVCDWLSPDKGVRVSLGISFFLAGFLAVNALAAQNENAILPYLEWGGWLLRTFVHVLNGGGWFMILFFALFAVQSYQELQMLERQRDSWDDRGSWPEDRDDDRWRR